MNDQTCKNLSEFETWLLCHGGDLNQWPLNLRTQGLQLIEHSQEAQTLWQRAQTLDQLLDGFTCAPVIRSLHDKLIERVAAASIPWYKKYLSWQFAWRPAIAFLIPLCLGLLVGWLSAIKHTESNAQNELMLLAVSDDIHQGGL